MNGSCEIFLWYRYKTWWWFLGQKRWRLVKLKVHADVYAVLNTMGLMVNLTTEPGDCPEPYRIHIRNIHQALTIARLDGGSIYEVLGDQSYQMTIKVKERKPPHSG